MELAEVPYTGPGSYRLITAMNVCIVGCGAIGSLLAAFLSKITTITVIDRGDQYLALSRHGLTVQNASGRQEHIKNLDVRDSLRGCGTFDAIFLAVKANEISELAVELHHLFNDDTPIITLQNGLPWWYFQRFEGEYEGHTIRATDPDGSLGRLIDPQRILGCVAYPAAELIEPGVIQHVEGLRFPVGELDGGQTHRVKQISQLMENAGLKAPVMEDIRSEIWLKAWGNLAFNPISALTHATLAQIATHPPTRAYTAQLMTEAQMVARRLGVEFRVPLERRMEGARSVGAHKTSMLQDVLAQRPIELDAILGSVLEIAELVEVPVPGLKGLYAMTSLRDAINREESLLY